MRVIRARNVNDALSKGLRLLRYEGGEERDSRAGRVLVCPEPVTTVYEKPLEKVVLWAERDANPFFHLFEALWMIAGRDDTGWLAQFNSKIAGIASDDGKTFHGAYGSRWRTHFGFDQIRPIAEALKKNPECRRQVLQMWDPRSDLGRSGKDLPCNICCHFGRAPGGELNMSVFCRSNDLVWGVTGSDSVDFSVLLEYAAALIGCPVGTYWQVSDNYHGYLDTLQPLWGLARVEAPNPYGALRPSPMIAGDVWSWDANLSVFMEDRDGSKDYDDPFFRATAAPMLRAWRHYKEKRFGEALRETAGMRDLDWSLACKEWLERRKVKWLARA